MTLPNWITVGRIALVPVFLIAAFDDSVGAAVSAFLIFLIASLSDSLDGYLARRMGTISRVGQFLDPTADKLLIGAALIVLVRTRDFPLWAALLIAFREVAVQILRTQLVRGGRDLPSSPAGKLKTVLQICMVCWWLLPWDSVNPAHWLWLAGALVAAFWSGAVYFLHSRRTQAVVG